MFETDFSTKLLVLNYKTYNLLLQTLLKVELGANWNWNSTVVQLQLEGSEFLKISHK